MNLPQLIKHRIPFHHRIQRRVHILNARVALQPDRAKPGGG
jgi:hypothetical protein